VDINLNKWFPLRRPGVVSTLTAFELRRSRRVGVLVNRFLQSSLLAFWAAYFAVQSRVLGFGAKASVDRISEGAALVLLIAAGLFVVALLLFVPGRAEERREARMLVELASAGVLLADTAVSISISGAGAASWLYPALPALLLTLVILRWPADDEAGTMQPEMKSDPAADSAGSAAFEVALARISGRGGAR
jgi:hypothetical protein